MLQWSEQPSVAQACIGRIAELGSVHGYKHPLSRELQEALDVVVTLMRTAAGAADARAFAAWWNALWTVSDSQCCVTTLHVVAVAADAQLTAQCLAAGLLERLDQLSDVSSSSSTAAALSGAAAPSSKPPKQVSLTVPLLLPHLGD